MDLVNRYYVNKNISSLKKLTLVIPTYNRNYYLSRCLWYHAHFPFGEIIVADSSHSKKKEINKKTTKKITQNFGSDIQYLEYHPETEEYGGDVFQKWGDAVQHVKTTYSQFCTDKEFIIPTTSVQSINFLDRNKDYVARSSMKYWIDKDGDHRYQVLIAKDWKNTQSITSSNSVDRYINSIHKNTNSPLFFSVHRSEIHKKINRHLLKYNINDIRFGGLYFASLACIIGKIEYDTNNIESCRDVVKINRMGKINRDESCNLRYPPLASYSKRGVFEIYYNNFRNSIENILLENNQIDTSAILKLIDTMHHTYMNPKLSHSTILNTIDKYQTLKEIWNSTPKIIKYPLKKVLKYDESTDYLKTIPNELEIIIEIIKKTEKYHEMDISIVN